MITELFIEDRRLDISADISSLLTLAIDDIRDFSSRQSTFSKTVVLPGTANNNAIFGNIFDTGITNDYDPTLDNIGYNFNASKSAKCVIFQDNMQTFKGTLRMLEIDVDKHQIEYQVALNGVVTSLSVALTNGLLTDLDFSAYDRIYNSTNISSSWFNAPGSGVMFPHIDYGTYSTPDTVTNVKHDWQFGTFRPALYVKEYIDKMFAAAGFRYESPLLDSDRLKRMVIPHNQKDVQSPKTGVLFTAVSSTEQLVLRRSIALIDDDIHFTSFIGGLFSTTDNKTYTYNGASAVSGNLTVLINGHFNYGIDPPTRTTISVRVNGSDIYVDPDDVFKAAAGDHIYGRTYSLSVSLNTGDTISVHYHMHGGIGLGEARIWTTASKLGFQTPATVLAPVEYGETIRMNYCIPQNIRQVDFLLSIVKLFNLYVYEDQYDDRLIHIKPFITFFDQGEGSVVDWTYKLNRDQVIKVKPMSELNSKLYNFNYAKDSDYYNDLYQKRYNQTYGSFIFDTEFEFSSNTSKTELIFAPTPLVGYGGEEKVYATIFKKSGTTEDRTDSVIRIMQTKAVTGLIVSWIMYNGATVLGTYNEYGYAGHYDDPDNPGDDLNFGGPSEIFFQLDTGTMDKTQFNMYWSQYMAEITDKDSKLLTARFYLTAKDIYNLRFSQFITVDGVLFRLNKITDYNTTMPDDCEVELIRVINTNYRYPIGSSVEEDYALLWDDLDAIKWDDGDEMLYN